MTENSKQNDLGDRTVMFSTNGVVYSIDPHSQKVTDEHGKAVSPEKEKRVLASYKRLGSLGY